MDSAEAGRRHVPYLWHQVAEYLVAAAFAVIALHANGQVEAVMLACSGLLVLSTLLSGPPFGALRVFPPRAHLALDVFVAAAFALSPLLYLRHLSPIPVVVSEAAAIALLRLSFMTEIGPRPKRARGAAAAPTPADAVDGAGLTAAAGAPPAVAVPAPPVAAPTAAPASVSAVPTPPPSPAASPAGAPAPAAGAPIAGDGAREASPPPVPAGAVAGAAAAAAVKTMGKAVSHGPPVRRADDRGPLARQGDGTRPPHRQGGQGRRRRGGRRAQERQA